MAVKNMGSWARSLKTCVVSKSGPNILWHPQNARQASSWAPTIVSAIEWCERMKAVRTQDAIEAQMAIKNVVRRSRCLKTHIFHSAANI
jgi:hypothetical protein